MTELSEAARALIRDGHSVLRPSLDDRSRVASALASRLGEGALVASTTAAGAVAGRFFTWQKLSGLIVGVGLVGLGATWALRAPTSAEPSIASPPAPVVAVAEAPPAPQRVEPVPDALPQVPRAEVVAPVKATPAADRLAEEVSILSKATSALRGGNPAEALRLLNDHQRRFPSGRLVEERRAARIQALCAVGNRAAAESELARLAQASPRSPHLARAQQACGFAASGG